MKKIFFMLTLFLGVILAGCGDLNSILSSFTFAPGQTTEPTTITNIPSNNSTTNGIYDNEDEIIQMIIDAMNKINVPETIYYSSSSKHEHILLLQLSQIKLSHESSKSSMVLP